MYYHCVSITSLPIFDFIEESSVLTVEERFVLALFVQLQAYQTDSMEVSSSLTAEQRFVAKCNYQIVFPKSDPQRQTRVKGSREFDYALTDA